MASKILKGGERLGLDDDLQVGGALLGHGLRHSDTRAACANPGVVYLAQLI